MRGFSGAAVPACSEVIAIETPVRIKSWSLAEIFIAHCNKGFVSVARPGVLAKDPATLERLAVTAGTVWRLSDVL